MKWYILTNTNNLAERGKVDVQANSLNSVEIPYRDDLARYFYEPVPDDLKIPPFKLEYRAKLTDWVLQVSYSPWRLLSKKFIECINGANTPTCKLFSTKLIDRKGNEYPYFIPIQNGQFDIVDYTNSVFRRPVKLKANGYEYEYEDFKATSFEDVRNQRGIGPSALYLKEPIQWDSFLLGELPFPWMVNEKVADALRAANITGICLIPFQQGDDFVNDDIISKAQRVEGTKL